MDGDGNKDKIAGEWEVNPCISDIRVKGPGFPMVGSELVTVNLT